MNFLDVFVYQQITCVPVELFPRDFAIRPSVRVLYIQPFSLYPSTSNSPRVRADSSSYWYYNTT